MDTTSAVEPARIVVVGVGGHARVVVALAGACGWRVPFLVDPAPAEPSRSELGSSELAMPFGVEVRPGLAAAASAPAVAIAIGDNRRREETALALARLNTDLAVPSLVHPSARVESSVSVGRGAQVCLGAILAAYAAVGEHAIINSGAIVDHECRIGAFAHISPGANLAGRVTVGRRAHIGIGASVIQGLTIGDDAVVGAGAVVIRDVEPGATVVGVPARPIGRTGP